MSSMKSLMLGVAVLAGGLGLGATTAQAAEFRIYAGGPVAYVPPCPGAGYVWVNGYMDDGYWIPGRWNFVGVREGYGYARFDGDRDRYARFDRERGREFERHYDRGRDFERRDDRDRGLDRHEERGRNYDREFRR